MACYHPIEAWFSQQVNASGKRSVVFSAAGGFGDSFPLPCGRCVGCRLERSRQWALRCVHEASLHADNVFLTLTYNDKELPTRHWTGEYDDFGQYVYGGTLLKRHWQGFMKRLRRRVNARISYFHCGEYGDRYGRPHYHACIFGLDFPDKRFYTTKNGHKLYTSETLDALWGHGFCTIGAVTFESAAYVARYVMKKITGALADAHYESVDFNTGEIHRLPSEYVTMSLKPAIGKGWYERYGAEVTQNDSVIIRGREMKPPKYYDKLLEAEYPEAHQFFKEERQAQARARAAEATPERLRVRETVALAKLTQKKRMVE